MESNPECPLWVLPPNASTQGVRQLRAGELPPTELVGTLAELYVVARNGRSLPNLKFSPPAIILAAGPHDTLQQSEESQFLVFGLMTAAPAPVRRPGPRTPP